MKAAISLLAILLTGLAALSADAGGNPTEPIPWGDSDCSGNIFASDATYIMKYLGGLHETLPIADCPALGDVVSVTHYQLLWGDIDCRGVVGPADALETLRYLSSLPSLPTPIPTMQPPPPGATNPPLCPNLGQPVYLSVATPTPSPTPTN